MFNSWYPQLVVFLTVEIFLSFSITVSFIEISVVFIVTMNDIVESSVKRRAWECQDLDTVEALLVSSSYDHLK
jgi:hypothetical protein